MNLRLVRTAQSVEGTFGVLHDGQTPLCVTLEPQAPIPAGVYNCIPHNGPHWQNVWELQNVPGHTAILIHAGNTKVDTLDCILVGAQFQKPSAITYSMPTLNMLRQYLPSTFSISIINAFGVY